MVEPKAPDSYVYNDLMCLNCHGGKFSDHNNKELVCKDCRQRYPIVDNIPVLINERYSVFTFNDFVEQRSLFFDISKSGKIIQRIGNLVPSLATNIASHRNFTHLEQYLRRQREKSRVLVLGGSIEGEGIESFLRSPALEIVESDVSFGPRTQIILDAHLIPYQEETFDAVIVQAVLEHVLDPYQCVTEIHRVLKNDGVVYAETPFMQQVHGGAYDFTRFTHSGHRRLFRCFDELDSGMAAGPGSVVAWTYQYLLLSLFGYSGRSRLVVKVLARITGFWLKYLDYLTARNPRSIDAASGIYFFGKKAQQPLSDLEIIKYYERPEEEAA